MLVQDDSRNFLSGAIFASLRTIPFVPTDRPSSYISIRSGRILVRAVNRLGFARVLLNELEMFSRRGELCIKFLCL
jgi:hypothetical protein